MILNPKYWGKSAAGVLPLCVKTGRVMLALRSQEVMEPGTWGVFGGRIMDGSRKQDRRTGVWFYEPIETPEEGALREFREETFYKGKVQLVPLLVFRDQLHGFAFHNFLGLVKREFSEGRVEDGWETEVARWMTVQQALEIEPKHFGLKALLSDEASLQTIAGYNIMRHYVGHDMVKNPDDESYEIGDVRLWKYDSISGFDIWVVNGSLIRSLKEIEFTIGGHHWRYPFIPRTELWIEDTRDPVDLYANAMHELIEATLMRDRGLSYDAAHEIASGREVEIRKALI